MDIMDSKLNQRKMKASTKLLLSGGIAIATVVISGELFDHMGILYGPTSAGLSGVAGFASALRLFSGS